VSDTAQDKARGILTRATEAIGDGEDRWPDEAVAELARVIEERDTAVLKLSTLRNIVSAQAEDEGLWFQAATAPEAYLQQELRKLHAAIEAPK
jgi:hypothetical protein